MNHKIVFSLVIAGAASCAFAQSPPGWQPVDFVSMQSREAVQAELVAFKKSGVNPWSGAYDPLKSFKSAKSRAEVTSDFIAARAEVAAMTSEDSGSTWLAGAVQAMRGDTLAANR